MLYKYEISSKFFRNRDTLSTNRKKKTRAAVLSNTSFNEKKTSSSPSPYKITSIRLASSKKYDSHSSSFKKIIASSTPSFLFTNFNFISQTNVIEFSNTNNNLKSSQDQNDNNFLTDSKSHINSKELNYKPEVGIRIALMLGSMMCLIILYLLWRNRCHCLLHKFGLSCGKPRDEDYDMEYWLNEIDNQKLTPKTRSKYYDSELPGKVSNPRQQTAAWIVQHKKIWINMHKINVNALNSPKQPIHAQNNSEKSRKTKMQITSNKSNPKSLPNDSKIRNKNEAIFMKQTSRRKSQCYEDLDAKTQLLINYARIDAITNSKLNKILDSNKTKKIVSSLSSFFVYKNKKNLSSAQQSDNKLPLFYNKNRSSELSKLSLIISTQLRKRSYSWPRCKSDNLNTNIQNRELRALYLKKEQKQRQVNKIKTNHYPEFELWFDHREEFINIV